jgi:ribosomal protein S18 acetylase RimI-like enzyme
LPGGRGDGTDIELKRIYVLSRFHGSGIGAALLQTAIEASRSSGASRILLGVYAGNDRARQFYRRHGFRQVATRQFTVGGRDYDDTVLALDLA